MYRVTGQLLVHPGHNVDKVPGPARSAQRTGLSSDEESEGRVEPQPDPRERAQSTSIMTRQCYSPVARECAQGKSNELQMTDSAQGRPNKHRMTETAQGRVIECGMTDDSQRRVAGERVGTLEGGQNERRMTDAAPGRLVEGRMLSRFR